ncbi:hypothetical protein BPAE_0124g00400 [Botrytis paeoniae]|uniref:Uncharacterized protein n=1 Tax=Botrytis paeoniae TaxID=278948 RepID=A0A4Z1FPT3_9HELO|nr:hypothetical protein BPAE_0124g00400 [Botrytis paeoniae]
MAPYIDKRKKRGRISHQNAPTVEAQPSEESKERKVSKNFAARIAIAAKLRQERRNQRRLAKRAALNPKGTQAGGDVDMKPEKEEEKEDQNDNVYKAMDILEDKDTDKDKEGDEDRWGGGRGAGSTWEIPIQEICFLETLRFAITKLIHKDS